MLCPPRPFSQRPPDGGSEVATFLMLAADTCSNHTAGTALDVA